MTATQPDPGRDVQATTSSRAHGYDRNPQQPAYAAQLAAELRRRIDGEVRFGAGARALYAYDASIFRQVLTGVVLPRDAADTEVALEICRRYGASVLARGCGTGLAGQTVNAAVVFDFSKYMNTIVALDPEGPQALVQPGVICDELRDAAEDHGLTFGPDPATHDHATLGGMIGNDSCGTHSVMADKTTDNIDELDVLTYDGRYSYWPADPRTPTASSGRSPQISCEVTSATSNSASRSDLLGTGDLHPAICPTFTSCNDIN